MSIYLYIFIMTLVSVFVMLVAINACLKSHDKIFDEIEKVKQMKTSNTNELSWKPSKEQIESYGLMKTDTIERVHGWVARDKYNDPFIGLGLIFHHTKPTRRAEAGEWSSSTIAMHLSYDMFPDLKWEDDPIEVDLLIVKKNKNN